MVAIRHIRPRQRGDAHRALALTINLDKDRTKVINCRDDILLIHRPAPIDDTAQPRPGLTGGFGGLGHTFDHSWGSKEMGPFKMSRQIENFQSLKSTRGRQHVARPGEYMHYIIQTRPM